MQGGHGVGARAQPHVPDHQRLVVRLAQSLEEPRLFDVERARLLGRIVDRVHDLARDRVADTTDAVPDHDLVPAALEAQRLTLGLGDARRPRAIAVARIEHRALLMIESVPRAREDVLAHGAHELLVEVQIVVPDELPRLRVERALQMHEVRDRVRAAGVAGTGRVERALALAIRGAAQRAAPGAREHHTLLRHGRGQDAVEHVHAAVHGLEQVERRADAHEVARQFARQQIGDPLGGGVALLTPLAHCEPTDREAIERQLRDRARALEPQVLEARALHDAEQGLR
jgi:hypothetical protein